MDIKQVYALIPDDVFEYTNIVDSKEEAENSIGETQDGLTIVDYKVGYYVDPEGAQVDTEDIHFEYEDAVEELKRLSE